MSRVAVALLASLSCLLVGCDPELQEKYVFDDHGARSTVTFVERIEIMGTNLFVNYVTGDDPTDIFSRERMEQDRTISGIHTISTNEHTYLLEQDVMKTVVMYISGFHFSEDGETEIVENPLQGETLHREYGNGKWGNFSLLTGEMSEELAVELGKVNDNYALEKGIYPEFEVCVGDAWGGTNFVENSDGTVSEFVYRVIFEKVGNHRGYSCAQLNVHKVLHSDAKGLVLDLKGTAYYSLEHGIELDSETSGSIRYGSEHESGDHVVKRLVEGGLRIKKTAELSPGRRGQLRL